MSTNLQNGKAFKEGVSKKRIRNCFIFNFKQVVAAIVFKSVYIKFNLLKSILKWFFKAKRYSLVSREPVNL